MGRIVFFDIAKGIGIILTILGHNDLPECMNNWLWTFHMPLFFIIAGYFYSYRPLKETFKKEMKQLFLPYVFTKLLWIVLLLIIYNRGTYSGPPVFSFVLGAMLDSGSFKFAIGWFLICLIWGKLWLCSIVRFSQRFQMIVVCILFAIPLLMLKIVSFGNMEVIPFFFHRGLTVPLYLYIGILVREYHLIERIGVIPNVILFTILLSASYPVIIGVFDYSNPTWNVIISSISTIILLHLCRYTETKLYKKIVDVLVFYGKNSLLVLCVHGIEFSLSSHRFIPDIVPTYLKGTVLVIVIGVFVYMIKNFKIVKYIYNTK